MQGTRFELAFTGKMEFKSRLVWDMRMAEILVSLFTLFELLHKMN